MRLHITLIAAASALMLSGLSAEASCAPPGQNGSGPQISVPPQLLQGLSRRQLGSDDAAKNIVGTWLVTYTVEGNAFGEAYIQWHSDGTEWENINLPVESGNICMGEWKELDSKHVYRNHWGWLYTDGTVSGYFNETETDKVGRDGTYAGTNEQIGYDLNGNETFDVTGASSAVRINP